MNTRTSAAAAVAAVIVLTVAGCGEEDNSGSAGESPVVVVASTNVWGDVAAQVGGDAVEVTSIISDPSQDPHSYQANATTALAVSNAELVIENGGGYDDYMDQLLDANGAGASVINAVDVSGKAATAGEELNEHVWYDLPTVADVADQIAAELGRIAPDDAEIFLGNADTFKRRLDELLGAEAALKKQVTGMAIGITEPVPLYLTEAVGLVNKTPEAFSEAIEEGSDVSPAVLLETLDLYADHEVSALVYNEQTSGPITEKIRGAAEEAGVPVVPVTETLPEGREYVGWMRDTIANLGAALT